MAVNTALIIGLIIALIGTILAYIFVMPERSRDALPGFLQKVHDFFNFKTIMIEKIVKALNVFATIGCIATGFFLLFGKNVLIGLVVLIIGPFVIRAIFELIMLAILMVQNVISINRKMQ